MSSFKYYKQIAKTITISEEKFWLNEALKGSTKAESILVNATIPTILGIATRHAKSSVSVEDMIQEGILAVYDTINRYKTKNIPYPFRIYVGYRIKKSINKLIGKEIRYNSINYFEFYENYQNTEDEEGSIYLKCIEHILRKMIKSSENREATIICMRYGILGFKKSTLKECSIVFGISKERVRQIQKAIEKKLRGTIICN